MISTETLVLLALAVAVLMACVWFAASGKPRPKPLPVQTAPARTVGIVDFLDHAGKDLANQAVEQRYGQYKARKAIESLQEAFADPKPPEAPRPN